MAAKAPKLELITNEVDPDLAEVKRFIKARIAEGAIAVLIAAILALLARMRDVNAELSKRLEASRRKRPPSETLHRLQLELPLWGQRPDNDVAEGAAAEGADAPKKERKKRGPKQKDLHGRPKLPAHLPRAPDKRLVPEEQRTCPTCQVEAAHVTFKPGAEKLDLEPARYVVRQVMHEVIACQCCHAYVVSAPKGDEIVDRGILGDELVVRATVDHVVRWTFVTMLEAALIRRDLASQIGQEGRYGLFINNCRSWADEEFDRLIRDYVKR